MSVSNENSQSYSQDEEDDKDNDNENDNDNEKKRIESPRENDENKEKNEELEIELVLKNKNNNKNNNITEEKAKDNDLVLPKIDINCSIKPVHENNINISPRINEKEDSSNENNFKESENNSKVNEEEKEEKNNKENENKAIEEKLKEKEEKLLITFNRLKKALIQTCTEIEENLNRIYYPENTEALMNLSHVNNTKTTQFSIQNNLKNNELNKEEIEKEKENLRKIKNYKFKIKSAQNELDIELKINKADELESIFSQKKKYYDKICKENEVLKKIKDNQENEKSEVNYKAMKKEALISMNEKILKIKEEINVKRDYYKTIVEKMKSQNEKIKELQERCDLINENIEYYKKKQIKEIKKQNEIENGKDNKEIDLEKLEKDYKEKMSKYKEKEEKLKSKVKEQNIKIKNIVKENENLNDKIYEIVEQIKNNMSQIITYENNIKRKELQIYDRINKKNNTLSERKPFNVSPINATTNKQKSKKIFDYQKYLKNYEKVVNKNRLYTSADTNKPKTLKEIEKLKTDIQQTIERNELDEKIKRIIKGLKSNSKFNINNNDEEDALQKFLRKNEEANYKDRYNFYVTEGANLPVPVKLENINNLNYN